MSNLTLMPWAPSQWTDSLGNILEFGILRFYEAGTLIPKPTYKKADGTEANTNPVILDAGGAADIWLGDGAYRVLITDSNGVQGSLSRRSADNFTPVQWNGSTLTVGWS